MLLFTLEYILIDSPKMAEGSEEAKNMENRVVIFPVFADAVKNHADGIHHTTRDHPCYTSYPDASHQTGDTNQN